MPIERRTPAKYVHLYTDAIEHLYIGIEQHLKGEIPDVDYIFHLPEYATEDGPAILAVAEFDDTYVVYIPDYLTKRQCLAVERFLHTVDPEDHIIVFNQENYETIVEYLHGKPVDVKLLT